MLRYLVALSYIVIFFCGCAGTHGYIKAYEFDINTDTMRVEIEKFIENSDNIQYLERKQLITEVDSAGNVIDTLANDDYYNDGKQYSRITILHNVDTFEFVFHYRSASDTLYQSNFCTIGIIQAFKNRNQNHPGGYNRYFKKSEQKAKQSYIKVFETEFIDKLPYKYIRTEEP